HGLFRPGSIIVQGPLEFSSCMRPAGQVGNPLFLSVLLVNGIAVSLQVTPETAQHGQRRAAAPGGAVVEQHGFIQRTMVYPIVALMGSPFFILIQYFYR